MAFLCMASVFGSWFLGTGLFISTLLFLKISDLLSWLWRTDCFYSFDLSAFFAFSLLSLGVVSSFRGLLWYFVIERLPSSSGPPF